MIFEKGRHLSSSPGIYSITDQKLLELLIKSEKIYFQHVCGSSFAFPRKFGYHETIRIDDQHKAFEIGGTIYLSEKNDDDNFPPEKMQEIIQKFFYEKEKEKRRERRKKMIMASRTLDEIIQLSNQELAEIIQIYIEKFEDFYPFEPDFAFESTQRGYLRSIEFNDKMFSAKLDIPRSARVMHETVLFQRSKAIDIVSRYFRSWRYFHDVTRYVQEHPERMNAIDWDI